MCHKSSVIAGVLRAGLFIGVFTTLLSAQKCEAAVDKAGNSTIAPAWLTLNEKEMFKPVAALESWVTYSVDEKKNGTSYKNRGDVSFRRFRFGGCGSPYSWLEYVFQLHLDRLGEDGYAATKGSYGGIGIWNAMVDARLLKKSDALHFNIGYYWAAISRETNTSPWAVGSFDKTQADWYLKSFTTGKGNGIESGFGFAGNKNFDIFGISYRVGTYEPAAYASSRYADRLYTGRLMLSIGDPEQKKYKHMLSGNQWGKRNGVTLGAGASTQKHGQLSELLTVERSNAYGGDVLVNAGGLRIDGAYFIMQRTAANQDDFNGTEWHIRCGYTVKAGKTFVEPSVSYDRYDGDGNKTLFRFIGDDHTLDIGINWYLSKDKCKLALHYLIQDGSTSSNVGDYAGGSFQFRL